MYAVAFDLVVADTEKHHTKGVAQAYTEIGAKLGSGSIYLVCRVNQQCLVSAR